MTEEDTFFSQYLYPKKEHKFEKKEILCRPVSSGLFDLNERVRAGRKVAEAVREVVFKMERPGLVEEGQVVQVSESITPINVNYMIEPAVAMSGLFKFNERLKSREGVIKSIIQNDRGYYVTVEFDE